MQTGKPLDLAVDGQGYVEVLGPSGQIWLWRGGTLRVNGDGLLETEDGMLLKAMIDVPKDSAGVSIDRDGVVRSVHSDGSDPTEIGTLTLTMPRDPSALENVASGYYAPGEGDALETLLTGEDGGVFVQGSLEASNAELTTEMVALLMMQRAYGANAQIVQAGDQLMAIANGLRR
jgi:flagellar basal-body rod protein FlgG